MEWTCRKTTAAWTGTTASQHARYRPVKVPIADVKSGVILNGRARWHRYINCLLSLSQRSRESLTASSQSVHFPFYNQHQHKHRVNPTFSTQPLRKSSIMPERGQSPPPERQTGKQQNEPAGSGKGVDDASQKEQINKSGLENLTSNPKGPLDDEVEKKFAKTSKPEESK